ncbi:rhamnan synthesis F family protein [Pseudomonas nitroreducens]|uniref:rhamnan synthesis F family protein n=1 Tax=Pseudomonas nitroreducens TaxID=46680 RepID=UPI001F54F5DD|nr:rhamnan synthesis F family protein [Pseudomonas nitroreducens]
MSRRVLNTLIRRLRSHYYQWRLQTTDFAHLYERAFYLQQYPDIAGASISPEEHFYRFGRFEGRIGKLPQLQLIGSLESEFSSARETILVVSHEASRTGAPILSLNLVRDLHQRYNVIALLLGDGPLVQAFRDAGAVVMGPYEIRHNPVLAGLVMGQLVERCRIKFALVNSIESRVVLPALAKHHIPRISLLHEFAAYTRPRHAFRDALFWSSDSVFSARLTLMNTLEEYPDLADDVAHIMPQGRCTLPDEGNRKDAEHDRKLHKALRPSTATQDTFLVVGLGFVQVRKGVDLFIECASRILRSNPSRHFRFVWIGKGYDPEHDVGYSVYLADQVKRSGLEQHLSFIGETSHIDIVYQQADALLLTSRLDPLPNVAIDALCEGLPVLCYENTTGIADILIEEGLRNECVARYLDSTDLAGKVLRLAEDPSLYQHVVRQSRTLADRRFNMTDYVARLEALAAGITEKTRQEAGDNALILQSGLLRQDFYSLPRFRHQPASEATLGYVRAWACGMGQRKPFPGFHPGIYQELNGLPIGGPDPLADYLRNGKPEGPWISPVISSTGQAPTLKPDSRVALHLHVYYPKLLGEMLARLKHNSLRPDLFVSVPSDRAREAVNKELGNYPGVVKALVTVPNRGRDIGPFLTQFGPELVRDYDFVGHLHTKMSADVKDRSMGETWYHFLLENLLGGQAGAMADRIIATLQNEPLIGMVFPDDPNAIGWSANRPFAEELATRLGIGELPDHLQFPVGTMFWARSDAIRAIVELDFQWQDYPEEPLPYDGSMLHALERLFPLSITDKAMRCAVTNIPGMTR